MHARKKVIVVGTGAGGAVIANELQDACDVTILEAGREFRPFSLSIDGFAKLRKTGLFLDERMVQLLIPNMQVRKSESMVMVNGIGVGGTTTLATGNAVRCDDALRKLGLNLDEEFDKLYQTLPITTQHKAYWNPATQALFSIFDELGLQPQPTPKLLKTPRCANCGRCAVGCPANIKWDTRSLIEEAIGKGAKLVTGCRVKRLLTSGGEATGVLAQQGVREVRFSADMVILAAGGFGTPVILENSGIPCEQTLFVDPVLCVAAVKKGFGQSGQLLMPFYSRGDGYMLSPYLDYLSFFFDRKWRHPRQDIVSLMIKMADDSQGASQQKAIRKSLTQADEDRLKAGTEQCLQILDRMGVRKEEAFLGILNAGHPGGMLALNEASKDALHDGRLPENLYVADATLLPKAAGMPPILTIMAVSLKVAKRVKALL